VEERGLRGVLGTVMYEQQRQLALAGRPHAQTERTAEHADRDALGHPTHCRLVPPARGDRLVDTDGI
jgi:hypothetical protein